MDKIETLACGSVIQHGKFNDRVYLMKASEGSDGALPEEVIGIAEKNQYTKVFAKIPGNLSELFVKAGFNTEAMIPGFYEGSKDGVFAAFYLDENRTLENDRDLYEKNRALALDKKDLGAKDARDEGSEPILCTEGDAEEMADIYRRVFPSYPFPIDQPDYIKETMRDNVKYFSIKHEGKIVALSSSEIDKSGKNVEMTDFATLPEWRGKGFGQTLLNHMEKEMARDGIKVAYTIARAASAGMNITFSRLGYLYSGRLVNNTNISGKIESMNVWYKNLISI